MGGREISIEDVMNLTSRRRVGKMEELRGREGASKFYKFSVLRYEILKERKEGKKKLRKKEKNNQRTLTQKKRK